MENIEWIFSGIGTQILSLIIGGIGGGIVGYRVGIRKTGIQRQTAKDGAAQRQEMEVEDKSGDNQCDKNSTHQIKQIQKAGKDSKQTQAGRIRHGNK